jgi:hypothetical protein
MDRAGLDAYAWTELKLTCAFLLDYKEGEGGRRQRRKPCRYRWPDDFRGEGSGLPARVQQQRAEQEQLAGQAGLAEPPKGKRRVKKPVLKVEPLLAYLALTSSARGILR